MYISGATPKKEVNDLIKKLNQNKDGVRYSVRTVNTPLGKMYSVTKRTKR